MPTRMIREGLIDSERYAQLTDQGRIFFIHLMLVADDFGCCSLSPTYLRRRCFFDSPSNERIAKLICELADADLIRTYEVDRRALAFIPRFRQRLNRATSKYPIPHPALYADDLDSVDKFNDIAKKSTAPVPHQSGTSAALVPREVEVERKLKGSRKEVEVSPTQSPVDNLPPHLFGPLENIKTSLAKINGKT